MNVNRFVKFIAIWIFTLLILPASANAAANPAILYTDIVSGPNTGGEGNNGAYLSLFGKNFGANLANVKVYVGGGEVARYMYLGSSLGRTDIQQLSVQLGPNAATGNIRVVVNGLNSNTDHTFTVRAGDFYYVSLSGNDSTGVVNNINMPYRTPNYVRGLAAFGPGDFIIVRGGTYDLNDGTNNAASFNNRWLSAVKSGSAGYPLAFMGYPGEAVIMQKDSYGHLFRSHTSQDTSWWVVSNFKVNLTFCDINVDVSTITLGRPHGTCPQTSGGRFSNGRIVNIRISGGCGGYLTSHVEVGLSSFTKLLGVSVVDSSDAGGSARSHPLYLTTEQNDTELGWCAIERFAQSRALIQVHTDSFSGTCFSYKSVDKVKIHDNVIHDITGQAILVDGGTGDVDIYNNIIYAAPYKLGMLPYEDIIALRGGGGHLNARVYNNTIYVNPNHTDVGWILGFGMGGYWPEKVELYNNIFYITDPNDKWYGTDNTRSLLPGWIQQGKVTSANNIWYGLTSLPPFAGATDKLVDPLLVNPSLQNFNLQEFSPARENGTSLGGTLNNRDYDGAPRLIGTGFSIGAFEYKPIDVIAPKPPRNPKSSK